MSDRKEVYVVTEFDTNRPRVFATKAWALDFAVSEKAYAEEKCRVLVEFGADDEAEEARDLLEGGFIEPAEWVGLDSLDEESYAKLLALGPAGGHWNDF